MREYGMNARVRRLREKSLRAVPSITLERAQLVTEVYHKFGGKVSTPVLRALAFKNILENKAISIEDDELIVGERGPAPAVTPTYPELCCHSLEDFETMDLREKISFKVSQEAREIQKNEIIPFWEGKSIRDHFWNQMTQAWKALYSAGVFTEFMEQRAPGHTVADEKIYNKGFEDFKKDIQSAMKSIDYLNDKEAYNRQEELKAMLICCDAMIQFGQRYASLAFDMASKETDSKRVGELMKIHDVCSRVPKHAPRDYHEALQMYWFVHLGVILELNTWDAFCPGKLDLHLQPFYEIGLNSGTLSRDKAKELLECFFIKFNNQPSPPKVGVTLKESGTYTDFCNINIGGIAPDGSSAVNDMSYLLLEVIEDLRILQPSNNIQVSHVNPDEFILEAGKVIREGMGFPSVFNADAVVKELLRCGKSEADALRGGTSGCVEVGCFGKEAFILTGYLNLTKILEITLNGGIDPRTNAPIGLKQDLKALKTFDDLLMAYRDQLEYVINTKMRGNQIIEKIISEKIPAPFMSVVIDDCIQKGVDYNSGGARYNTRYIQGVGIGTITDTLSAIKKHVYENRTYSLEDLVYILKEDLKGYEKDQMRLKNKSPKYGNDDDEADDIMKCIFNMFYDLVDGRQTVTGGTYHIQMLPTTSHVYFGSVIGATADGRNAGLPLSEGISPVQGADKFGPTAVIRSAGKMDHIRTGGTLLNQRLSPDLLAGPKGLEQLKGLIRAYFAMDGHHIQFNVFDVDQLKDAQRHPDRYENLIVRVAGYSDYFNNLNKDLQDEIIERTEQNALS